MDTPSIVYTYILTLSGTENSQTCDNLLALLPKASYNRYSSYSNVKSRIQSLAGELLARYAASKVLHIPFIQDEIVFEAKGKPYFKTNRNLHFNISHASNYIACAICNNPVGIDVEKIRKINLTIAERYFTPTEVENLMKTSEHERIPYFIQLWTIKESYLKAIGTGLALELNSFNIEKTSEGFILNGNEKAALYGVYSSKLDEQTYMAICSLKPYTLQPLKHIELKELLTF